MSKLILFQGDSITDSGRDRSNSLFDGYGYATMVKGLLGCKYPEEYTFMNKGISGNRITDLYARVKSDVINLNPDYLSILIGVNDVWHEFTNNNGVSADKFRIIYSMLIDEIKQSLPDTKIMILEPFVLKGIATTSNSKYENLYSEFRKEVEERAKIAKDISKKFSLTFVELQNVLDKLFKPENPEYWLYDGVHPTAAGHAVIAGEWIKVFERDWL